ncbi:MAG TPA: 23S rRNA (pseudouridine(1915)-N(3))-methyltransferase RlmH [Geobacteraceae bacterium]
MRIRVLWVGKSQEEWVRRGIEEYAGRIRRYLPLEIGEVREEKGAQAEAGREAECARLLKALPKNARLVILDERGDELTSPQLAAFLGCERDRGVSELVFAVGGAYGFSETFRARAARTIALSRMTFTHQMVRIFLLEQIYRGFTILNNEPYHH